jgi:hypothetical protein
MVLVRDHGGLLIAREELLPKRVYRDLVVDCANSEFVANRPHSGERVVTVMRGYERVLAVCKGDLLMASQYVDTDADVVGEAVEFAAGEYLLGVTAEVARGQSSTMLYRGRRGVLDGVLQFFHATYESKQKRFPEVKRLGLGPDGVFDLAVEDDDSKRATIYRWDGTRYRELTK